MGKKYLQVSLYYKGQLLAQGNDTIGVTLATNVQVECFDVPASGSHGENPVYFNYCETDFGNPQAAPPVGSQGKALQIFYKYVRDANDNPKDFTVYMDLKVPYAFSYYDNPVWEKVSGPNSGGLSSTTSLNVGYENPKKAGLYEFKLKTDYCADTRAAFLLPGAGGKIDQWLIDEIPIMIAKAAAWEQAVRQVARDNNEIEDDFLETAWMAIASADFDYQGLAIVDQNIPTRRYNFTDVDQQNAARQGDGDWNEPSYATLRGLVVSRSKINNLFYAVWGRELGYNINALSSGALFNAIKRGRLDDSSSQASIAVGSLLYGVHESGGDMNNGLDKNAVSTMQTPDVLNDKNLWPSDQIAVQNFTFPTMPTTYEMLDEGADEVDDGNGNETGNRGRLFRN